MNYSGFFTLLGFEAHRILLHALEELADSACLDGYQLSVVTRIVEQRGEKQEKHL
jgi:hypothetical protein